MAKIVLSGSGISDLVGIEIADLWDNSTAVFSSGSVGVVDTGDADLYFQGSGFSSYDSHGYATAGTITKFGAVFAGDDMRVDWTGLSLDAATFQHTVRTGNSAEFISDLFGGNDKITMNSGGGAVSGFDGNDTITGKGHTDFLIGADGNDVLKGAGGNDTLVGDAGKDVMTGGAGIDTFFYRLASDSFTGAIDIIKDLNDVDDTISLSSIDADTSTAGDDAFFIAPAFTGIAGQLVLTFQAGHNRTVIAADTDGVGGADLIIYATGDHHSFTNFDF